MGEMAFEEPGTRPSGVRDFRREAGVRALLSRSALAAQDSSLTGKDFNAPTKLDAMKVGVPTTS